MLGSLTPANAKREILLLRERIYGGREVIKLSVAELRHITADCFSKALIIFFVAGSDFKNVYYFHMHAHTHTLFDNLLISFTFDY